MRILPSFPVTHGARRVAVFALSGVYFFQAVVGAYAGETRFWQDRRAALRRQDTPSPLLFAQVQGQALLWPEASVLPKAVLPPTKSERYAWLCDAAAPYGTVPELFVSPRPDAPLIVHIQDAHEVEEAQTNTAGLIADLSEKHGVRLVGLEGAVGAFDLENLRSPGQSEVVRGLAMAFTRLGYLGGAELAAITAARPPLLWGIENPDLYRANLVALRASSPRQGPLNPVLSGLQAASAAAERNVSAPLVEFASHQRDYAAQVRTLAEHVQYLWRLLPGMGSRFPNAWTLRRALDAERKIDFALVEKDRRALVEALAGRLSPKAMEELAKRSVDCRLGRVGFGEYYGYLNRLALGHGITLSAFRSLPAYADYVRLAESVQREKLLAELTALADLAGASLAKTEIDKRWLAAQKDLGLLTKLRNRAMTPAAWEEYRSRRDEILRLPKTLGALAGIPLANISPDTVAPFEAFCRLASARNEYLVRNILEKMKVEGTKTGVLVAGGFHTRGLVQLLREAGVSYAVVTPRLTEVPKVSMDIFARDPLPLEKRVGGEIISLAYARLTQIDPTVKGAEPGALRRAAKLALIFAAVLSTTAGPLPAAPIPSLIHQEVQVDDPRVRAVRWTSPAGANPLQFDVVTAPTSVAKENPAVLGPSPILQFSADNQAVAVGRLPAATRETVGPWVGAARYFATRRNLTRAAFWLLAGIGAMVCPDLYHLTLASLQDPSALFLAAGVTAMPLNKTGTTPPMNWREISKEYLTKKYARLKGARPKAVVQDLFRADLDLESMEDAPAKRAPPATAAEIFNELEGDIRALQAGMAEIMPDAENDILDAIAEFLFQFPRPGADISLDHLKEILGNSHNPARAELIAYFKDRFDPDQDEGLRVARSKHHLSNIATLLGPSERKIDPLTQEVFAAAISFVGSVEKTNFFCPGRVQLAFSIIPKDFPGFASDRFPEPPYRVIFVHVPYGGFGFHVRMEDIARGGLREISPADSRRMLPEDYDLAVTMGLKNLDIDTGGSKGIVYCDEVSKQVAVETGYLMGLLDFMTPSDFIVGAPGTKIKPDELYLGPDTGTGYLPNLAKTLARMRGPHKTPYKYWRAFMTGGDFPALGGISHGRNNLIKRDKDAGNHVNSIGVVAHIMRNMHALGVDPVNGSYSVAIWGAPAGDVAGGSLLHLLRISPGARIRAIVDHTGVVFDPQGIDPDALLDLYEENGSAANFRGPLGEGAVSIAWSGGPFELNSETLRHMNARVLDPLVNKAVTAENVIVLERVDGIPSRVRILNPQFFWSEISHFLIPADVFIPADRQHDRITSANAHLLLDPSGNPIVRTIVCGANNWVSNGANAMLRRMNIYPTPDFVANKWGVNVSHRVEVAFALLFSEAEGTKPLAEYFEIMLNLFYRETQREHFAIWRASEQESATGGEPAIEMAKEIRRLTEMIYRSDDFDFGGSGVWTWAREEFPLASGRLLPMGFLRARWKLGAARLRRTAAQTLAKNIVWNAGTEFTRRGAREFDCSEIDVVAAYARAATAPLGVPNVPPGRTFQEIVDAELKVDQPFVDMTAEIGELEKTLAARIVKILSEKRPPRPSRAQPAPKPLSGPRFSDARRDFENRLRDARNRFDLQNALDIFREEVWSEPGSVASRSRLFCQGVDEVVRRLLTMHGLADRHSIAVAAAGAYGRRELGPTSVVEVVVPSQGVEDEFGSGFDRIFAQFQSDFIFIFHQDEAHHPQLLSRPLVSIGPVRVFQGLVDARCIAGNSQIFRDYQDTMDHRLGSEFSPESVARGLEESWRAAPHTDGIATWDRINFLAHLAQRADRSWLARHLPNHVWLALRGYLSRRNSRNARASFRRLVALAARGTSRGPLEPWEQKRRMEDIGRLQNVLRHLLERILQNEPVLSRSLLTRMASAADVDAMAEALRETAGRQVRPGQFFVAVPGGERPALRLYDVLSPESPVGPEFVRPGATVIFVNVLQGMRDEIIRVPPEGDVKAFELAKATPAEMIISIANALPAGCRLLIFGTGPENPLNAAMEEYGLDSGEVRFLEELGWESKLEEIAGALPRSDHFVPGHTQRGRIWGYAPTTGGRFVSYMEKRGSRRAHYVPPQVRGGPKFDSRLQTLEFELRRAITTDEVKYLWDEFGKLLWEGSDSVASKARLLSDGADLVVSRLMQKLRPRSVGFGKIAVMASGAYARKELGPNSPLEITLLLEADFDTHFGPDFEDEFKIFRRRVKDVFGQETADGIRWVRSSDLNSDLSELGQYFADGRFVTGEESVFDARQRSWGRQMRVKWNWQRTAEALARVQHLHPGSATGLECWAGINKLGLIAQRGEGSWWGQLFPLRIWLVGKGYLSVGEYGQAKEAYWRLLADRADARTEAERARDTKTLQDTRQRMLGHILDNAQWYSRPAPAAPQIVAPLLDDGFERVLAAFEEANNIDDLAAQIRKGRDPKKFQHRFYIAAPSHVNPELRLCDVFTPLAPIKPEELPPGAIVILWHLLPALAEARRIAVFTSADPTRPWSGLDPAGLLNDFSSGLPDGSHLLVLGDGPKRPGDDRQFGAWFSHYQLGDGEVAFLSALGFENQLSDIRRFVQRFAPEAGDTATQFSEYALIGNKGFLSFLKKTPKQRPSGGEWPAFRGLYDYFGKTPITRAILVSGLESLLPAAIIAVGLPWVIMSTSLLPVVGAAAAYQLFWHLGHLVDAEGTWPERIRFAFSGEKLKITLLVLATSFLTSWGVVPYVPRWADAAVFLADITLPHFAVNWRIYVEERELEKHFFEWAVSRKNETKVVGELTRSLLGGRSEAQIPVYGFDFDHGMLHRVVGKHGVAREARRRLWAHNLPVGARPDGPVRAEDVTDLFRRLGEQHGAFTGFLGERRMQTVLAALLGAGVLPAGTSRKTLSAWFETWMTAYHGAQNIQLMDAQLEAALESGRPMVFELSKSLIAGKPTSGDNALLRHLEYLAARAGRLQPGQVVWLVPGYRTSFERFLGRHPKLTPLAASGYTVIRKSALAIKRGRDAAAPRYSAQILMDQLRDGRVGTVFSGPWDMYLNNRREWDVPPSLRSVMNVWILFLDIYIFKATESLRPSVKSLNLVRRHA